MIANLSVRADSISVTELKRVYLEQTRLLGDGSHVEPVLEKGGYAHATFLKDFLDINDDALQSYYRTLVFTGRGSMPRALDSDSRRGRLRDQDPRRHRLRECQGGRGLG